MDEMEVATSSPAFLNSDRVMDLQKMDEMKVATSAPASPQLINPLVSQKSHFAKESPVIDEDNVVSAN